MTSLPIADLPLQLRSKMLVWVAALLAISSATAQPDLAGSHTVSNIEARGKELSVVQMIEPRMTRWETAMEALKGNYPKGAPNPLSGWKPNDVMPIDPKTGVHKVHPSWNLPPDYNEKAAERERAAGKPIGSSITNDRENYIRNGHGRLPTVWDTIANPELPEKIVRENYVPSSKDELQRFFNDPHPDLHPVHEYRQLTKDRRPLGLRESKSSSNLLIHEPTKPYEVPENSKTGLSRSKSTSALIDESPLKVPKGQLPSDADRRQKLMHQFVQSYPGHMPKDVQEGMYKHAKEHEGRLHTAAMAEMFMHPKSVDVKGYDGAFNHMSRWVKHTNNMYPATNRIWSDMHNPIPLSRDNHFYKAAGMPRPWFVKSLRGGPNVYKYLNSVRAKAKADKDKVLTPLEQKRKDFDKKFPQRKMWDPLR